MKAGYFTILSVAVIFCSCSKKTAEQEDGETPVKSGNLELQPPMAGVPAYEVCVYDAQQHHIYLQPKPVFNPAAAVLKGFDEMAKGNPAGFINIFEAAGEVDQPKPLPPRLAAVPFSTHHRVVFQMNNLAPNQSYQMELEIFDAAGVSVAKTQFDHVSDGTAYLFWQDAEPKRSHKPGQWTAKFNIQGVTPISWKYKVLPPTEMESKFLASHEASRDATFRAVAHYWCAMDDSYICSFGNFEHSKLPIKTRPSAFEDPGSVLLPSDKSSYLEIAGIRHVFGRGIVTEADFRNGITYRGEGRFLFTTFRVYTPGKGWSPWFDVPEQQDFWGVVGKVDNPFAQLLANIVGVAQDRLVDTPSGILNLRYNLEQRDGNWFIRSDSGDSFINGKRDFVSKSRVTAPSPEMAKEVQQNPANPRKRAADTAEASAKKVGEIIAGMEATVEALKAAKRHP